MENIPEHNTSIVSIVGKDNKHLFLLANLYYAPFDPESVLTVVVSLEHKPEVSWNTIHSMEQWCTSMDRSLGGNLFVVTMEGELHKFDGNQWGVTDLNCPDGLNSVWAANDNEVFIAGLGGERIRVINDQIELSKDPNNIRLNAIHGSSVTNVVAVGDEGMVFKYDGNNWRKTELPTNVNLLSVYCRSDNEILIGGAEVLYRWDGVAWHDIESQNMIISSIEYFDNSYYLACGDNGVHVLINDKLALFKSITVYRLKKIDSLLFAIGNRLVAQFDGQEWWGGDLNL